MNPEEFKERTKKFALRVMHLTDSLPNSNLGREIGRQLLRSGMSVGANYRAACRARSKAEFMAKMGIVEELSSMMTTLKESRDPLDRNMRKVELALEMERTVKQIEEADLEGHYVQGERIVPAGGMGSWTAEGLKENIVAQMSKFVDMLRQQNYQGAYEELFGNKAFQSKLEALVLLDQKKLPRR